MNSLTHPTPAALPSLPAAAGTSAAHWTLLPLAPVQTLACPAHQSAVLEVLQGCAWVTCDGCEEDYFLAAGERLDLPGPATLRVSAEGAQAAWLAWRCGPCAHVAPTVGRGQRAVARVQALMRISAARAWACRPSP
ncbi:DUF2917 domain-containing protein [Acidovorax sp. NCPPB 3576]|uniref:DUF2917 domain-containing protein n=1 Tax=Acidovorax sp. NCPPB 3576 TaxID=2940488 RepID=UPI00234BCBAB|nr:DUF2917 domain-containing protein [Acidovorax sp. NCPPB 3576]WCM89398.1 DUF2917 domain-containing protein [Acidovorax sp. NCPPB 3576]